MCVTKQAIFSIQVSYKFYKYNLDGPVLDMWRWQSHPQKFKEYHL